MLQILLFLFLNNPAELRFFTFLRWFSKQKSSKQLNGEAGLGKGKKTLLTLTGHLALMFHCRDDSNAAARIPNGSCHAGQHARDDGDELWLSDASWTHGHAGVCQ